MSQKKKENKLVNNIKNISKNPRGRAMIFFLFYLIFFVFLISFIRTGYTSKRENVTNNILAANYDLAPIINGNYHFVREEMINNDLIVFVGDKENNKTQGLMTRNNIVKDYFLYSNINLLKEDGVYRVTTSLYNFGNITNENFLKTILKRSTLISKTEYQNGGNIYNYQITSNTIEEIINKKNIDIEDIPNIITLETNEFNQVIKITYDLSSYASYLYHNNSQVIIKINYSNFGEIKEITIPDNK